MLRSFFPWIIFYILNKLFSLPVLYGSIITLVTFSILCHMDLRRGYFLSWLTPLFLISIMLNVLYLHWRFFQQHSAAMFYAALAVVAWGSIVLRVPFTLQYSRASVPQEKWQHPLFLKINYMLSFFWAMIFSLNLSMNWIFPDSDYFRICSYVLTAIGMYIATLFPAWYRKRWHGSLGSAEVSTPRNI